jgi:hypothetical protein
MKVRKLERPFRQVLQTTIHTISRQIAPTVPPYSPSELMPSCKPRRPHLTSKVGRAVNPVATRTKRLGQSNLAHGQIFTEREVGVENTDGSSLSGDRPGRIDKAVMRTYTASWAPFPKHI